MSPAVEGDALADHSESRGEASDKGLISSAADDRYVPKVRDALKLLAAHGWAVKRVRGSHRQLKHSTRPGTVTVPGHRSDEIAPGTWRSILKQAGLSEGVGE